MRALLATATLALLAACGAGRDRAGSFSDSTTVGRGEVRTEPEVEPVVIGIVVPASETAMLDGIKLAIDEELAAGDLPPIETVVIDADGTAATLHSELAALVARMKPVAVITDLPYREMSRLRKRTKAILVTPTQPTISRIIELGPKDGAEAQAAYKLAIARGRRTAVVIADAWAPRRSVARLFERGFTRLGGTVLASTSYHAGATSFVAEIAMIQQHQPDLVFVSGNAADGGVFLSEARAAGVTATIIGTHAWDDPAIVANPDAEGVLVVSTFAADEPSRFLDAYQARHDRAPDRRAAAGHDAAVIVLEALRRAGTGYLGEVEKHVTTSDEPRVPYATGIDRIKGRGPVGRASLPVLEIKGGKLHLVERVSMR